MSADRPVDPVEDYLDQLYASLRTTPRQARRIIAEAEDHLREATAAGVEAGLTELEAQEAAISSFGSVRAVVRAHARRVPPLAVFGELVMSAWRLATIAVLAVAGSGLVALVMNQVLGPQFVGGSPAAASGGIRRAWARTTARTETKLEMAASWASSSVRPASIPAVVASRRWSSASAMMRRACRGVVRRLAYRWSR